MTDDEGLLVSCWTMLLPGRDAGVTALVTLDHYCGITVEAGETCYYGSTGGLTHDEGPELCATALEIVSARLRDILRVVVRRHELCVLFDSRALSRAARNL